MKRALFILTIIFSSVASYGQGWEWARGISCNTSLFADAITTDPAGNVYVAGGFTCNSLTFGNFILNNTDIYSSDIFIVKYDPQGNVIWAKSAGGSKSETVYNIAADGLGNIYITGTFYSPALSFGNIQLVTNDTMSYNEDLFLAKYDTAGNAIWAVKAGDSIGSDRPYAIAFDGNNNVYIAGQHGGDYIDFGTGPLFDAGNGFDFFLAKFNTDGINVWAKTTGGVGGNGGDGATSLSIDLFGNLYVAGLFQSSTLSFDNFTLVKQSSAASSSDMFLVKFDTSGNAIWAKNALCGAWGNFISSTTDYNGNIYISGGYASPSVVYGTTTLPYSGATDIFIAKYNSMGDVVWAKGFGGNDREFGHVMCDSFGNIYAAINFESPLLTIGNDSFVNHGEVDVALVYFNPFGDVINATSIGGVEAESIFTGKFLAMGDTESIYLSGRYQSSSVAFGTDTVFGSNNPNNINMFLAKWVNTNATASEIFKYSENLTIYPNPAYDQLNIETTLSNYNLSLVNTIGQVVYSRTSCAGKQILNTNSFASGVYYLKIESPGKERITKKVVIQH